MKKIEILHIASFTGNIGDNASHNGLYYLLKSQLNLKFNITQLEIRKAYLNYNNKDKWTWNKKLIDKINNHDITIIGGGNYFAPWLKNSTTGTTIDLSENLINLITKPVIFHGIGFDPYVNGYTKETIKRFTNFLEKVIDHKKCLIVLRNDGSKQHLNKLIKKRISSKIREVPDSGFFIKPENTIFKKIFNFKYIAINIAKDMIDNRFYTKFSYNDYLHELVSWFTWMEKRYENFKFVFIPHIYGDIEAINDLLKLLPDMFIREKVIIAPHIQGKKSENLFSIYQNAQFSIGNRFHTNVCSIGLKTPSIALVTYQKLHDLYVNLNLDNRVVIANKGPFNKQLKKLTISTINNRELIEKDYIKLNHVLLHQANLTLDKIHRLIYEK